MVNPPRGDRIADQAEAGGTTTIMVGRARLGAVVGVGVRQAARESGALTRPDLIAAARHGQRDRPASTQIISLVAGACASPPHRSPGCTAQRQSSAAQGGSVRLD